ncbi:MAG: methionine--tRNA ligase [Phycisphaerae bacterium]|nr:methionine--tRNA ligase [Phycisphaerae bacterium]
MTSLPKPAYITTPIYYVNDKPHIGHAYTTTLCDVWARAMRFRKRDVFFLTGTDEHGRKVEKSAQAKGVTPQELADENSAEFRRVLGLFGLTNDHFIRTTHPAHKRQVQTIVKRLIDSGHVYLGEFEGWYDEGQEEYHTETKAKELDYKSPISGRPLLRAKEKNYYFRLSEFQTRLEEHLAKHPEFVRPEGRRNEVLGRLSGGLQDVPVTRTSFTWGIALPDAPGHVIYVWIDALLNYATALGLADDEANPRKKYWPATYHVVGKEILWFHAVIWPAMLMALGWELPKCIYAHSFWISDGQKMSKSLGNFIDLPTIQRYHEAYSLDAWRWYMVTQGPLDATDADFSAKHFHETYTSQLVNTFANCASRTSAMIEKYFDGTLPPRTSEWTTMAGGRPMPDALRGFDDAMTAYEEFRLHDAATAGLGIIRWIDLVINEYQPFKMAKSPELMEAVGSLLHECAQALCWAAVALHPIMPTKCEELLRAFGVSLEQAFGHFQTDGVAPTQVIPAGTRITKCALFMRVDPLVVTSA